MTETVERVGRVRKGKRTAGFTVVRNDLINHPELSIEARALLIYLLSRPEDWEVRVSDVRRFLGTGSKPCGRDKGYNIIAELKRHHFVVMCEDIDGKHFAGVTYYIFEEPVNDPDEVRRRHREGEDALDVATGKPLPEKPDADQLSLPDLSHPENKEQTKERYIQNTDFPLTPKPSKTTRRKGSGRSEEGASIPVRPILKPWTIEWVEARSRRLMRGPEKRAPKPTRTIQAIIDKGGGAGERERLLQQAGHCWPSVMYMDGAAAEGRGCYAIDLLNLPSVDDLKPLYRSVATDSEELASWQDEHRKRGWPVMPLPTRATHVWLPKAGIAALNMPNDQRSAA